MDELKYTRENWDETNRALWQLLADLCEQGHVEAVERHSHQIDPELFLKYGGNLVRLQGLALHVLRQYEQASKR